MRLLGHKRQGLAVQGDAPSAQKTGAGRNIDHKSLEISDRDVHRRIAGFDIEYAENTEKIGDQFDYGHACGSEAIVCEMKTKTGAD